MKRIIATFIPQRWVNDYAVEVDPEGETKFDVTDEILMLGREKALALEDRSYDVDDFRFACNAPEWILQWNGPFEIEVHKSIMEYFDVGKEDD